MTPTMNVTTEAISMKEEKVAVTADEEALDTASSSADSVDNKEVKPSCMRRVIDFYWKQEFLILVVLAIPLARAYPELGAVYLKPKITATWIAVCLIFLMAGLCLKTEEFKKAFLNMRFNAFVLIFNFFVVSSFVFGVSRALLKAGILSQGLADGMAVCGSLPVTVNMALVFAKVAGGDEAAAVFNTAVSNMIGVFLSPVLIVAYVGITNGVLLVDVFWQLALRVIVPLVVGNSLQFIPAVHLFVRNRPMLFKRAQQYCLIFIIYTIFCKALLHGSKNSIGHILLLVLFEFLLQVSTMTLAWFSLKALFRDQPKLRVSGLFICMHKTISIGVPLITVLFKGDPQINLYTLPILIWHPMQLVVGTLLMPRLTAFVKTEQDRLGNIEKEDTEIAAEEGKAPSMTKLDSQEESFAD